VGFRGDQEALDWGFGGGIGGRGRDGSFCTGGLDEEETVIFPPRVRSSSGEGAEVAGEEAGDVPATQDVDGFLYRHFRV